MKTIEELEALLEVATRERDEARADAAMLQDRLSESRDEVERLADERDELLVRVAEQDAELRATREAYGTSYRRGAEAMREACIAWARAPENDWEHLAHELEGMPILEES